MSNRINVKSLPVAIRDYLKNIADRTERSLLKQFKKFMQTNYGRVHISDVTTTHFDELLNSLSLSPRSLKTYMSILNRFKRHIGLSTPPSYGGRKSKKKELEVIRRKLAQKDDVIARHQETIYGLTAKYGQKLDAKKRKIEELNKKIKMITSNKRSMKELDSLDTTKAQLEREIADLKERKEQEIVDFENKQEQMRKNVEIFKVTCSLSGKRVSLGNDCHGCNDFITCLKYAEMIAE